MSVVKAARQETNVEMPSGEPATEELACEAEVCSNTTGLRKHPLCPDAILGREK